MHNSQQRYARVHKFDNFEWSNSLLTDRLIFVDVPHELLYKPQTCDIANEPRARWCKPGSIIALGVRLWIVDRSNQGMLFSMSGTECEVTSHEPIRKSHLAQINKTEMTNDNKNQGCKVQKGGSKGQMISMTVAPLFDTKLEALASLSATRIIATSMMEVLYVPNYALLVREAILQSSNCSRTHPPP